jgi:hypothetical protein
MFKDGASTDAAAAVDITATAFRDDRSAELVTITDLSFDGCHIASAATFAAGERLRLHMHGQGLIEAQVEQRLGDQVRLTFLTKSKV